jgi:hypothetical protein
MQREQELSKEIKKGLNTITQHKFQEMEEQIVEHSSPHPKPVNKLSLLKKIFVRKVKWYFHSLYLDSKYGNLLD